MGLFKSKAEKALTHFGNSYTNFVADFWRQYLAGTLTIGGENEPKTEFQLLNGLHRAGLEHAALRTLKDLRVEVDPYYFDDIYFQLSCMRYGVEYSADRVLFSSRFGRAWIADGGPIKPTR